MRELLGRPRFRGRWALAWDPWCEEAGRDGIGGIVISSEMPEYSRSLAWGPYLRWECIPIDEVGAVLSDVQAYIS